VAVDICSTNTSSLYGRRYPLSYVNLPPIADDAGGCRHNFYFVDIGNSRQPAPAASHWVGVKTSTDPLQSGRSSTGRTRQTPAQNRLYRELGGRESLQVPENVGGSDNLLGPYSSRQVRLVAVSLRCGTLCGAGEGAGGVVAR